MTTITFYRQARRDGGIRTGIDINDDTVYSRFDGRNGKEPDPSLVWYVDVRCRGSTLPTVAEAARAWLLAQRDTIDGVLRAVAESIPMGIDPGEWPLQKTVKRSGAQIEVACSAVRRIDASKLAEILREIGEDWEHLIESLDEVTV